MDRHSEREKSGRKSDRDRERDSKHRSSKDKSRDVVAAADDDDYHHHYKQRDSSADDGHRSRGDRERSEDFHGRDRREKSYEREGSRDRDLVSSRRSSKRKGRGESEDRNGDGGSGDKRVRVSDERKERRRFGDKVDDEGRKENNGRDREVRRERRKFEDDGGKEEKELDERETEGDYPKVMVKKEPKEEQVDVHGLDSNRSGSTTNDAGVEPLNKSRNPHESSLAPSHPAPTNQMTPDYSYLQISMDPYEFSFDVEAYKKQAEIEERFMLNHFRERRRIILEATPRSKRKYINRDHAYLNQSLIDDYFSEGARCKNYFRRRFRMEKHVFLRIVEDLSSHDKYFTQRFDAAGKEGISPLAKCTTAMRMLAYGMSADVVDEYIKIGETTALETLVRFCKGVIKLYEQEYLRAPNEDDLHKILEVNEKRGFPGMIGSIDCMHWEWKNCPTAWEGQFIRGDKGTTSVILEAVAGQDLWIWHAFFGCPGRLNDINVLDRSPVFDDIEQGITPRVNFFVNQRPYNMTYYLVDDIYPSYPTFVKSVRLPQSEEDELFAKVQEGCRKDIERAFGVLQARFKIIREPARLRDKADLAIIMRSCVILHNMIVEDERDTYAQNWIDFLPEASGSTTQQNEVSGSSTQQPFSTEVLPAFENHVRQRSEWCDSRAHRELQADLIKHIWAKFGM